MQISYNFMNKYKYIALFFLIIFVFVACKKDDSKLYGISIETNKMINSPAEVFSLQQIKIFMASNDFTLKGLPFLINDNSKQNTNFAFSPLFLTYTIAQDSSFDDYLNQYEKQYNISLSNKNKRIQVFNSFLSSVKDIDSSINITSKILENKDNIIKIQQSLDLNLNYDNINIEEDNYSSKQQIIISDEFSVLESSEQTIVDILVGNGNYILTLIQPKNASLQQYIKTFNEEKYASLINQMENRKTSVVFPLIEIDMQERTMNDINLANNDSLFRFPKEVVLDCHFAINHQQQANTSFEQTLLKSNTSKPISFNKDFLFILRGKSSNLIMFIGYYSVN